MIGHARIRGLVDDPTIERLRQEAAEVRSETYLVETTDYYLGRDGELQSPARFRAANPGPVLQAVHASGQLVRRLRRLTGQELFPARSGYNFYCSGDFIALHQDAGTCPVTVTMSVLGDLEPMQAYPSLRGMPSERLLEIAKDTGGFPRGGARWTLSADSLLVINGACLPHARPPNGGAETVGILAMCYVTKADYAAVERQRDQAADRAG